MTIRSFDYDLGTNGSTGRGEYTTDLLVSFPDLGESEIAGSFVVVFPFFCDFFDTGSMRNTTADNADLSLGHGFIEYQTVIAGVPVTSALPETVVHTLLGQPPDPFYAMLADKIRGELNRHLHEEAERAVIEQFGL